MLKDTMNICGFCATANESVDTTCSGCGHELRVVEVQQTRGTQGKMIHLLSDFIYVKLPLSCFALYMDEEYEMVQVGTPLEAEAR